MWMFDKVHSESSFDNIALLASITPRTVVIATTALKAGMNTEML
jgi:hypothetical protein